MSDSAADTPEPIGGYASYDPAPPRPRRKARSAAPAAANAPEGESAPKGVSAPETAVQDAPKQTRRRRSPAKKS